MTQLKLKRVAADNEKHTIHAFPPSVPFLMPIALDMTSQLENTSAIVSCPSQV